MDLIGAEIFAVGKWNGMEFTEEDIDDIVANFEALGEIQKVPLKLGHNDEQPVTDGQPALGWVSRVYKQGSKLLADFTDMPKVIYEAVKNKMYRTVSVELLFGVKHKNNEYANVLDAVALLGADQPAVNTLNDLGGLLASRQGTITFGRRVFFDAVAGNRKDQSEEIEMDKEEVKQLIAAAVKPLETKINSQDEEISTLKTERDDAVKRAEKAESEQAEFAKKDAENKVKAAREAVNEILDQAVKDGAMTPALREVYSKQIGVEDDEKVVDIDLDQVKLMCKVDPKAKKGDKGETGMYSRDSEGKGSAEEQLLQLTNEAMAKGDGKEPFRSVFTRVCTANPKLHQEYLESNVED